MAALAKGVLNEGVVARNASDHLAPAAESSVNLVPVSEVLETKLLWRAVGLPVDERGARRTVDDVGVAG